MKKTFAISWFLIACVYTALAQCAMCKAGAETSVEAGNTQAIGINNGVLYILFFVLLFLSFFAFILVKGKKMLQ